MKLRNFAPGLILRAASMAASAADNPTSQGPEASGTLSSANNKIGGAISNNNTEHLSAESNFPSPPQW